MNKIRIKIISVGNIPKEFDKRRILNWKSELFTIIDGIQSYSLPSDSDGFNWEFTDVNIQSILPTNSEYDIRLVIVNVPLEDRFYARRLVNNTTVITFSTMREILQESNIPLENLILRVLYAYSLLYLRNGNKIPEMYEIFGFTHDETRGCLYDMNGIKTEIVYSTDNPILCDECYESSKRDRVSLDILNNIRKEIKRIRKPGYYRIIEYIKRHPKTSLVISAALAILIGIIGNLLSNIFWELWIKQLFVCK